MKAIFIKQKKAVELLPQMQTAPGNLENRIGAEPTGERDLLRTLIDNLPDYIYVKDRESRFLINNLAHVRILGATHPDEVAGRTDFDYFPKELAGKFFADEQALMQSGQVLDRVESVVDKTTGKLRWLQTMKIARRDGSGKVIGLMGISRDITEQKRAEEALRQSRDELEQQVAERTAQLSQERLLLRTLIDNLPDGVYAKDTAGRKTMANPADLKNLGCKTEAEAIGKKRFRFLSEGHCRKILGRRPESDSGRAGHQPGGIFPGRRRPETLAVDQQAAVARSGRKDRRPGGHRPGHHRHASRRKRHWPKNASSCGR